MATKAKAPARSKPAAKPAAKAAVKPAAGKTAVAKVPAKVPAKVAKGVSAPERKPARPASPPAASRPATRVPSHAAVARTSPAPAPSTQLSGATAPRPPLRTAQAISPKDLAAAHEYLLSRSATRSGEPVMVNGRRLPTEEELLAMPDADYMNDRQLAYFKYQLQLMERELLSNADETTEHLRETVIVPDPADRATIEEEHALELRTRDRERKLLKKVQASLRQIESGEYGFCEETGDPIGVPRLLARPTATLSLEAQQRREIKQKLFGD